MKTFLKILLAALLFFLAAGMVQESRAFFAGETFGEGIPHDPEHDKAIETTIREFLSLSRHLYESGGDPGFAERLPVSERVSEELLAELDYLRKNNRFQSWRLVRLELLNTERPTADSSVAQTKEYWIVETRNANGGDHADPVQSVVTYIEYRLQREAPDWQITSWDFIDAPQVDEQAPPTEVD